MSIEKLLEKFPQIYIPTFIGEMAKQNTQWRLCKLELLLIKAQKIYEVSREPDFTEAVCSLAGDGAKIQAQNDLLRLSRLCRGNVVSAMERPSELNLLIKVVEAFDAFREFLEGLL